MNNNYKLNLSKYSTHSIILNNIGKNKNVLDVGSNDGYICKLSDKSNHFWGLDYSQSSVEISKGYYEDSIVYDINMLEKLPWKDIKFDIIIFGDVLEHLVDPNKVLKFFVENYLKEEGTVIISLPNIANWKVRLKLLFGKFDYTDNGIMDRTHLSLYTFKTANEFVTQNNLSVIKSYGGASVFGPVIKYIPILKPLLSTGIIFICQKK